MLPDLVRIGDVCSYMNVSESAVRLWVRLGKLPAPRRLSYHMRVWDRADLLPHLAKLRGDGR